MTLEWSQYSVPWILPVNLYIQYTIAQSRPKMSAFCLSLWIFRSGIKQTYYSTELRLNNTPNSEGCTSSEDHPLMPEMESSCVVLNQNSYGLNEFKIMSSSLYHKPCIKAAASLPWLDLRVFYVRVCRCELNDSTTPEFLTLNHIPLNRDTLLEVNGARASIYADGVTMILKRDRVDTKSEEATFVSTDNVRVTGSVKFEVFDKDVLIMSGVLEISDAKWSMDCESDAISGPGFLKGTHHSCPPKIEVYVAGCFIGRPIILTKMLQLGPRKKLRRKSLLDTIPEHEATECLKDSPPANFSPQKWEHLSKKIEKGEYGHSYYMPRYIEGEDGELSWFNAGVRVGVGIGLSACLGIGVGVGLLARAYQGTTRRLVRRLL